MQYIKSMKKKDRNYIPEGDLAIKISIRRLYKILQISHLIAMNQNISKILVHPK